jgi:hypothetical protein
MALTAKGLYAHAGQVLKPETSCLPRNKARPKKLYSLCVRPSQHRHPSRRPRPSSRGWTDLAELVGLPGTLRRPTFGALLADLLRAWVGARASSVPMFRGRRLRYC